MRALARWFTTALLLALGATAMPVVANTTICIKNGDSVALDNALKYWGRAVDETVYIHIEQGTYTLGRQDYFSQYDGGGNASLHFVGGFVSNLNHDCTQRVVDASNTLIQGSNVGADSYSRLQQVEGTLLVDGVTFRAFAEGISFSTDSDSSVTLRNIIVTGMTDPSNFGNAALSLWVSGAGGGSSSLRVENCLIYGNDTLAGLSIFDRHSGDSTQVINCTIADNTGYGVQVGGIDALNSDVILNGTFSAHNLILRNNAFGDIAVNNNGNTPAFSYSDFNSGSVVGTISGIQNVNGQDPLFIDPSTGKYQLPTNSPLINIGAPESMVTGGYADKDIRGRQRVVGSHIDMGAYETLVDDNASQPVGITADTSTGQTLRAAINVANSSTNPTTINFNITNDGPCPHFIDLTALLPNITSNITIDGYSQQPGAAVNAVSPGYDGNVCIVVRGGGRDHALMTSGNNARLTVRGIEFEGFSSAAIRLASGSGHVVAGNGFAAFPGSTANKDGVLIEGTATASRIGGSTPGDRNVFAQSTEAAIKLLSDGGNHLIDGNYIGFNFDGTNWSGAPNKYGIYVQDSKTNGINRNFIGDSANNAIRITGTNARDNRLTYNTLGTAPANDLPAGNGSGGGCMFCFGGLAGIALASGAHDNFVGSTYCTANGNGSGNVIVNNFGPGVSAESTAGTGNRVCGNNLIHDNGGYLATDLGAPDATANDNGDIDTGANNLQNYPFLSQAMRIEAGTIRLSGFLQTQTPGPAQTYRLDVYWTDSCVAGDATGPRGEFKRYVGSLSLQTDGNQFFVPFSTTDIKATIGIPGNGFLSATATDGAGNTSEPGPCHTFVDDYIFADSFRH